VSDAAHALDVLLRPAWRGGRVVCLAGDGRPVWLHQGSWRLYAPVAEDVPKGEPVGRFVREDGTAVHAVADLTTGDVVVPFSLEEAYLAYVSETWRDGASRRGLSARQLAVFYRARSLVPRRLQLAARRRLIRRQGVPDFPRWPRDTSVSSLLRFYAACLLRASGRDQGEFIWFWPEGKHAAVVLTHDVEKEGGIRLSLELADLEEACGFRSSFNFGAWYDVDPGILRELRGRGFEVGMHGLTHDRMLFSSREAFEERLPGLAELAKRLGAVGFRSPATHRVFDWLAELPVEYDCTIPNSDPYEPLPGGCCSLWPFFIGSIVELPYTLPQDHTLLTLLGHRSPNLWLEQVAGIEREHGLVQCVSHPDRGYLGDPDKRAVYAEFLRGLGERENLWRALPRDAASWWRRRRDVDPTSAEVTLGTARIADATGLAELHPPP